MTEVEAPGQLPGACDPAAELDLAQMGDDDALAGLGSGVHFAWQDIQQLMDSADPDHCAHNGDNNILHFIDGAGDTLGETCHCMNRKYKPLS